MLYNVTLKYTYVQFCFCFVLDEEKTISIAANHLELGKDYKMVIYYGPPHFLFSKEFTFKVSLFNI